MLFSKFYGRVIGVICPSVRPTVWQRTPTKHSMRVSRYAVSQFSPDIYSGEVDAELIEQTSDLDCKAAVNRGSREYWKMRAWYTYLRELGKMGQKEN